MGRLRKSETAVNARQFESLQISSSQPANEPASDYAIESTASKFMIDADRLSHMCSGGTIRLFLTEA
jgi:hypothetical protein